MQRTYGFVLLLGLVAGAVTAENSGDYRGPQNNGLYPAKGLIKVWPPGGPALLWKAEVGEGYGGVTVADDMVYIAGGHSGHIFGFNLAGEAKLKIPFGGTSWKRFGGTKSAVLVRDGLAVVSRPIGDLHAMDLKTGEQRWSLNAWKDFGTGKGSMGWGYPSTPPVFENRIILNPVSRDDDTPPIVAVDFATGKLLWQADAGTSNKYSCGDHSASVFQHKGRWLNVNPTWRYILCLDPRDGKQIWRLPDPDVAKGSEKTVTPVYNDGYLLFDQAGELVCGKLNADGTVFTRLWSRPHGGFSHAVILEHRVYVAGNVVEPVATAPDKRPNFTRPRLPKGAPALPSLPGGLLCLDVDTGAVIDWLRMGNRLGHVIAADGLVIAQDFEPNPEAVRNNWQPGVSQLGLRVWLLQPTADGMDVAGRFRLPMTPDDAKQVRELQYQANINPVVAAGRLFIRYGPLWVYDLRPGQPAPAAAPVPLPATGLYDLRFRGFAGKDSDLLVSLDLKDGTFVSGIAHEPSLTNQLHTVTATELKLTTNTISGTLTGKFANAEVKFETIRRDGDRLVGCYTGGKGARVTGRYLPK